MDLQLIKQYFSNKIVVFNHSSTIDYKLTTKEKEIFYQIGLPNYGGYGGSYIMLKDLSLIDNRYIKFATRKGDEKDYFRFLDTETHKVVFKFYSNEYHVMNSSLEAYLNYIYIDDFFFNNVIDPEIFGNYELNHQKYADELKKKLLEYNDVVLKGTWSAMIEEMGYGVV